MKSFVMAGFMLSVSLGNVFTALVNFLIQNQDGSSKLAGAEYFLFFSGAMLVSALIFIPIAMLYKEKHYIQDE
jgi:POT family proton-dependent oligopeptide transporter